MAIDPVRIRIKNYQSIEDVELEVSGFTVVTGRTNVGKSALVRAVSSAILNRPVVGAVRRGSKYASVQMDSSAYSFLWEKGERDVNRYTIGGTTYDAIGRGQFAQVRGYGFESVKVGDDEIYPWLADQFFPLFLLDRSGTQVTDFISEVSRLDVLQDAVSLSSKGKKRSSSEASSKDDESADLRKKEQTLVACDPLADVVAELEQQRTSIEDYDKRIAEAETAAVALAASGDAVRRMRGAADMSAPTGHAELVESLATAAAIDASLKALAKTVVAVRGVAGISPPEAPTEDINKLLSVGRFDGLQAESARLETLRGVLKTEAPNPPLAEKAALALAEGARSGLAAAEVRVARMSACASVVVPVAPGGPESLRIAAEIASSIATQRAECAALGESLDGMREESRSLSDRISTIQTCPTCDRPVGH